MRTIRLGDRGDAVLDVQARLGVLGYRIDPNEHGEFGPSTERAVREFQQRRELLVDGIVGDHTWDELVEASYALGDRVLYLRYPYFRGDDVRSLQSLLNVFGFDAGREDGIFGDQTERAVRDFQKNVQLPVDAIVGGTTVEALKRLRPVGAGPGRSTVREGEALRRLSATLDGARVAIDPGHGPGDEGGRGPTGLTEAEAAFALAQELERELRERGCNPLLLRTAAESPSPSDRAQVANDVGAEILVSIHLNTHTDAAGEGASTYYYGREGWCSPGGQRLAELIQEELTESLGLKDGRTHPKALPLLRETAMPAVHVEPCFITNPAEEARLRRDDFRAGVARAVADALERFFGRGAERPPGAARASAS